MKCGIEIQLLLRDEPPNPLEPEECGVSFVHVKDFRLDPESVKGVDAANPEHDFLAHSHFEVAAVKLGGDATIFRIVLGDVGVEQIKFHPPDVKFPKARVNVAVENAHRYEQGAIVAPNFADGQVMKTLIQTDGVLDAVLVDFLPEISVAVEEADGDEIEVEVAGGFAMVTGENAETAGIVRN